MQTLTIQTRMQSQMVDVTRQVEGVVRDSGVRTGVARLHVPHTTAAVTINENADPAVVHDLLADLERLVPRHQSYYSHAEGNSAAHLKSSLIGCDLAVLIEEGCLVLGTWQAIYFCEFDGPRTRRLLVQVGAAGGA